MQTKPEICSCLTSPVSTSQFSQIVVDVDVASIGAVSESVDDHILRNVKVVRLVVQVGPVEYLLCGEQSYWSEPKQI